MRLGWIWRKQMTRKGEVLKSQTIYYIILSSTNTFTNPPFQSELQMRTLPLLSRPSLTRRQKNSAPTHLEFISAVANPSYVHAHEWPLRLRLYTGELGQQGKAVVTSPQNVTGTDWEHAGGAVLNHLSECFAFAGTKQTI
jgi:hypothetical protein